MSTAASPIRVLRRSKGITAEQLAARAGLASATVYRAERGLATPSEETLAAIAEVLGVDPSDLHAADPATPTNGRGEPHGPDTAAVGGSAGPASEGA